ncbi:MAG: chaperone NapD [Deltaproteobacteria bacterium]|jgi:nitrate reductase NapAB chaperone NapD|nr:chaperone NapD [Deltaproteobacteria bacterium]
MAIVGFLVQAIAEDCARIEKQLVAMPGMTTYGIHKGGYVVGVAEAPSDRIESVFGQVSDLEGVLATYVTSMTLEDEMLTDEMLPDEMLPPD